MRSLRLPRLRLKQARKLFDKPKLELRKAFLVGCVVVVSLVFVCLSLYFNTVPGQSQGVERYGLPNL